MTYYGPADEARRYFYDMGYEPAPRQTTADFLFGTTDPCCRMERSPRVPIPRTANASGKGRGPVEISIALVPSIRDERVPI
jgi:hypothetical protein